MKYIDGDLDFSGGFARRMPEIPTFPKQISNSFWKGHRFAAEGAYWGMPVVALEAATAKPGEVIPTIAAQGISLAMQPALSGLTAAGLTASLGFPPAAAAIAATVLVGLATSKIEHSLVKGFSTITKEGSAASRLRFGGNFVDSQSAQQRRQMAAMEITRALPTSRRWLGQEALLMHR